MADFIIRQAVPADVEQVTAFHQENSGEYVWPRTIEQVRELTDDRRLLVAYVNGAEDLVGMVYVDWDLYRYERDEIGSLASWMEEFPPTGYDVDLEWFDDNVETAEDLCDFAELLGAKP